MLRKSLTFSEPNSLICESLLVIIEQQRALKGQTFSCWRCSIKHVGMTNTGSVALFYMLTEYSIWTIASERQAGGCRQEITGGQFLDGAGGSPQISTWLSFLQMQKPDFSLYSKAHWWLTPWTHKTPSDDPAANFLTSSGRKAWLQSWGQPFGLLYLDQVTDQKLLGEYTIKRQALHCLKNLSL